MPRHQLYELVQELLGTSVVSIRDMIGWIDFREHVVVTYDELADALTKLHEAGYVERVLTGYVAPETEDVTEPFRVPTPQEYEDAVAEYRESIRRGLEEQ
jgi:hypothetical protein